MTEPDDRQPPEQHYFSATPAADSRRTSVSVHLPDLHLDLLADRGVFSSDHLDAGTKLLLLEAPALEDDDRQILDLGCGWGPIACVVARRVPKAHIYAIDVNERALQLTEENSQICGTDNLSVSHPDDLDSNLRFDRILSNPPVRIGKPALHELLSFWLNRLASSGRAHLVVQKHLGSDSLSRWMSEQGFGVERIRSRAGYRILEVRPPAEADSPA